MIMAASLYAAHTPDIAPADPETVSDTLVLSESTVLSKLSDSKRSPLRLATVGYEQIRQRAASRTYPELLKSIPGLYATSESGSYGDAKLNIRGFAQENISVLLNGIPISGLTSGSMFWNNWMGLADATYSIQVQKSIGSSMLSDSSVGGSVNIITTSTSEKPHVEIGAYGTHYGTVKSYLNLNSGRLPKGWGINMMFSYVGGSGYVDRTTVNSYAYLLTVTKIIDGRNTLAFTALGSPEKHEQRSTKLSWEEIRTYGLKYNKNWGWRNGEEYNLNKNNYFKPYFTMQHRYSGDRLTLDNSVYLAVGNGGGRWTETKGTPVASFMKDGQIDFDAAEYANLTWSGNSQGAAEGASGTAAQNILSDYMAGHTQAGVILSGNWKMTDKINLGFGAHYQYYATWEHEKITDLLGADYWYEDYASKSLAGTAGRNPIKHVGDYVRTDNGKNINYGTLYARAEYESEKINANLGISGFAAGIRRWDKYNYVGDDIYSDLASGAGFNVKGGVIYRINRSNSIYANAGYYSRLPYSDVWFSSGNNEITKGVKNEKNIIGELGYRMVYGKGGVEITGYAVSRKNKSLMSDPYKLLDEDEMRYMITGLNAFHCGIELEGFHRFTGWLKLSAHASLGSWKWTNDVRTTVYDEYSGNEIQKIDIYCGGLPVGDAPQTQIGADMEIKIPGGFDFMAGWIFNDRMYADFDPSSRTDPDDLQAPYRIPSYHLLNATLSWSKDFRGGIAGQIFITGSNLLDTVYIERGKDGSSHDLDTFRGFWGFGRNFSFGIRLSFGASETMFSK